MRLAMLLICCAVALGQDTPHAPETKSQNSADPAFDQKRQSSGDTSTNNSFNKYGANTSPGAAIQQAAKAAAERRERELGAVDILSDTHGVDFGPYLERVLHDVRKNWELFIPESARMGKKGKLAIEFAITKDGQVADMKLVATSDDSALDRAAWRAIVHSNPFKPLPNEFTGQYLALRFRFSYNPDKSDLDGSGKRTLPVHSNETTSVPSKLGVVVSISSTGDIYLAAGESRAVTATVSRAKKQSLTWSLSGLGCSTSACGEMVGNLYVAPSIPPIPPVITLTATSKADSTAKASVRIHIVQPADFH